MTIESPNPGALPPAPENPPVEDSQNSTPVAISPAESAAPVAEQAILPAADSVLDPAVNDAPPATNPAAPDPAPPSLPATTPALLEAALPEPPRALVPGAFLRFEFEIKQVLVRGFTNLYLAQAGDYGATTPKLIAERALPTAPSPTPPSTALASPLPPAPSEASNSGAEAAEGGTEPVAATAKSGRFEEALVEDEAELTSGALLEEALADHSLPSVARAGSSDTPPAPPPITLPVGFAPDKSAPVDTANGADTSGETAVADAAQEPDKFTLEATLFPACEKFVQEDREYQVFDFVETTALQDYREPTNDVRYLQTLDALARGAQELESKHLHATLTRDILRFEANGTLRYYGFYDAKPPSPVETAAIVATEPSAGVAPEEVTSAAVEQLREINAFLLKRVFAESSTMRLGDEFGSLCLTEEVKELARRLHEHELASVNRVVAAIGALYQPEAALQVDVALLSNVGQERELNEDAGMVIRLQRAAHLGSYHFDLYVVADGMGGHEGGEVASNLTLTSLQRNLATRSGINWDDNIAVKQALLSIIDAVNADVVALTETPHYRMMRAKPGSTLVFAVRVGARVFVGNVGDSRAYKYNELNGLQRISKDHSYVQSLLDRGEITEEEAWDHPEGSIITAHIGDPRLKTRDVFLRLCAPGDKLLFVSDGVVDMLRDRDIATHLQHGDATTICHNLIEASNQAGGLDNITAICVTFAA